MTDGWSDNGAPYERNGVKNLFLQQRSKQGKPLKAKLIPYGQGTHHNMGPGEGHQNQ